MTKKSLRATGSRTQVHGAPTAFTNEPIDGSADAPSVVFVAHVGFGSAAPRMFAAQIERETKQFYCLTFDRTTPEGHDAYAAFGYRNRMPKDAARLTARAAWDSFIDCQRRRKEAAERELSIQRERLVLAERALSKLGEASHVG